MKTQNEGLHYAIVDSTGTIQDKFSTLEGAEKAATTLAQDNPGEGFMIYEPKKSYRAEPVVTVKTFVARRQRRKTNENADNTKESTAAYR